LKKIVIKQYLKNASKTDCTFYIYDLDVSAALYRPTYI